MQLDDVYHPIMRYPAEHKEETRDRIVETASRRFRRGGAGVGIAELMKALKLTHGGFYRHFRSKDHLFAEALARAFEEGETRMAAAVQRAAPGHEVQSLIEAYLTEQHCDHPDAGCPIATLAPEIARQSRAVRAAMERCLLQRVDTVARFIRGKTAKERRGRALALFSSMAGAMALARAVSDEKLRRTILESARQTCIETFASGK
jgi:TetR/AcrR family transcriptional repressor of nem operon